MRLARLLAVLQTSELYFARADTLGDPFEGSYSRANLEQPGTIVGREDTRQLRERSCVNCWHLNPDESAAMWKLYGASDHAVAIRSTTRRLIASMREHELPVYIGRVRYVDYDRTPIPEHNLYHALLHKRLSFEHEREVRAITSFDPRFRNPKEGHMPVGVEVMVDLEELIEAIFVAPNAPTDFLPTVGRAVADSGFPRLPINQSRLGEDPLF
jgi:hypothetical protein